MGEAEKWVGQQLLKEEDQARRVEGEVQRTCTLWTGQWNVT